MAKIDHIGTTVQAARNLVTPQAIDRLTKEIPKMQKIDPDTDWVQNAIDGLTLLATRCRDQAAKARSIVRRDEWREVSRMADTAIERLSSDWVGHPNAPVSDDELRRLIAEDWERTAGR